MIFVSLLALCLCSMVALDTFLGNASSIDSPFPSVKSQRKKQCPHLLKVIMHAVWIC